MWTGRLKPEANKLRDAAGCTGADSFELLQDITKIMHAISTNKKSFRVIISRNLPVSHSFDKGFPDDALFPHGSRLTRFAARHH